MVMSFEVHDSVFTISSSPTLLLSKSSSESWAVAVLISDVADVTWFLRASPSSPWLRDHTLPSLDSVSLYILPRAREIDGYGCIEVSSGVKEVVSKRKSDREKG